MPLRRLASLEQKKITQEHKEVSKQIKQLKAILKSDKKMRGVIIEELEAMRQKYDDRRRTYIVGRGRAQDSAPLTASDLAPSKDTWVVLTKKGLLSRTTTARIPRISGRAAPQLVIGANLQDRLFLFDSAGEGGALAVHTIPETDDQDKGTPFTSLCGLPANAEIATGISVPEALFADEDSESFLVFTTHRAMVKKSSLQEFPGPSAKSFQAIKVNKGDRLGWVGLTTGQNEILLVSSAGMAIRFSEEDVRPMGLSAAGVNGMRLEKDQELVGMDIVKPKSFALI
jgi:DNA gyrase subunit A